MIIKLTITAQSEASIMKAVEAAQRHLDALVEEWAVTLRFRASDDCTPFDLAGAMREVPGVRVEIEGELER